MSMRIKLFALAFAVVALIGDAEPIPRAGKPGPPMLMGTSVMDDANNQVVKSIGFTHSQTDSDHLSVNETSPGVWDWLQADAGLATMKKAGMSWQYFPHFHWPPEWYRNSNKFVPCIGLRSKRQLAAISIWSPDIVPWFDHGYAALAQHYGSGTSNVYALYLGIHGDFGETIFPMGWHPDEKTRFDKSGRPVPDFWCGDKFARADFQTFTKTKYKRIAKLNATWGTAFKTFDQIDYPPPAYDKSAAIANSPQARRYWLDFLDWYYDSMTRFTGEICRIARHYFPYSILELPVGGGSEDVLYGQDTTAIQKIARKYNVDIRSTHGGFQPFPQNYGGMLKKIATPCKIYGVPHWLEPPSTISPEGEISRIMEAISCGNRGFWDWGQNPVTAANVFRDYTNYLTQEHPIVDVALFFPTTDHRLHPDQTFPHKLQSNAAELRDVIDFDMLDETLIADDALTHYRVLIWIEDKYIEQSTLQNISAWLKKGGVLVWSGPDRPETIEGDTNLGESLLGCGNQSWQKGGPLICINSAVLKHASARPHPLANSSSTYVMQTARILAATSDGAAVWATPHGRGWTIAAPNLDHATWNELVRDAVYNLSALDKTKRDALEADNGWDGVYTVQLPTHELILHNFNTNSVTNQFGGTKIVLPPKSLRSVMNKIP
jgi:hypothetical protein